MLAPPATIGNIRTGSSQKCARGRSRCPLRSSVACQLVADPQVSQPPTPASRSSETLLWRGSEGAQICCSINLLIRFPFSVCHSFSHSLSLALALSASLQNRKCSNFPSNHLALLPSTNHQSARKRFKAISYLRPGRHFSSAAAVSEAKILLNFILLTSEDGNRIAQVTKPL